MIRDDKDIHHFLTIVMPPRQSLRAQLLETLDHTALAVARAQLEHEMQDDTTSSISSDTSESNSDIDVDPIVITPPSPMSPILLDISDFSDSDASSDEVDHIAMQYNRLQDAIAALRDEVEQARVLHRPDEPPM